MSVKGIIIEKFAKWYIGNGVAFESMKRVVTDLMDLNISNEDKKSLAIANIKTIGYSLSNFLLGIGIELALGYLKAQKK